MKKKALIVGIDYYDNIAPLFGCVNDAYSVKSVLESNADGTLNFEVKLLTATGATDKIFREKLRSNIKDLFSGDPDIALFYFAGHGHIEETGGYLATSDTITGDDGVAISDIITIADHSSIKNKLIILDSCHSGIAGSEQTAKSFAEIKEGTTILTASTAEQYASEDNGAGVFTTLLVDALNGAAANLLGDITPGSIYAHIDQSLGSWDQRPVFKTNVKSFVSLRNITPAISLGDLQRIAELFPQPGYQFPLDPTYEPERTEGQEDYPEPEPRNTAVFKILQNYNRVNLLVPVDAPHMWHAAMESKACKLTVLGEHYRMLVTKGRI